MYLCLVERQGKRSFLSIFHLLLLRIEPDTSSFATPSKSGFVCCLWSWYGSKEVLLQVSTTSCPKKANVIAKLISTFTEIQTVGWNPGSTVTKVLLLTLIGSGILWDSLYPLHLQVRDSACPPEPKSTNKKRWEWGWYCPSDTSGQEGKYCVAHLERLLEITFRCAPVSVMLLHALHNGFMCLKATY